ncbi:MAG: ATP-binding protein [Planctomycetes bacterium]|nr:ATP-binding protein [Planctomycetota bacterium]
MSRLDLLVLDELGYVPDSKLGAELLFDVISTAYERTSLIVTTNLPFENWVEVLGSERLTGATLDRLTHRCHVLECNGQSYRLATALTPAEIIESLEADHALDDSFRRVARLIARDLSARSSASQPADP